MNVVSIECEVEHIELKTPFITALRCVNSVEFVRVHIVCDNSLIGIGEAPSTKAITNEDIDDILYSIHKVKESLEHMSPRESLKVLHNNTDIGSSAKAAIDMALISLLAQDEHIPLYRYFGARVPSSLRTDITISLNEIPLMLQSAQEAVRSGNHILKVKVGADIDHAIKTIKTIATELPVSTILVDANQAWNVQETMTFLDGVNGVKIELIEQPVIASDIDGLKTVTEYSTLPVLADEAVFTLDDVKKVHQSNSADMINIKLMKCGGATKAIEILEYARKNKITCMLGSMLEGPFSINIALHLAMAYKDVIKYIDLDSPLLYKEPSDLLEFNFHGCEISLKS